MVFFGDSTFFLRRAVEGREGEGRREGGEERNRGKTEKGRERSKRVKGETKT